MNAGNSGHTNRSRHVLRKWPWLASVGLVIALSGCAKPQLPTILEAAKAADVADVERHLRRGAHVNAGDEERNTPLHLAGSEGHRDVVALLLANDADVSAGNVRQETPLHSAAGGGHLAADVNAGAEQEMWLSPLQRAASGGNKEIVELLISHGADVSTADYGGGTPLHRAASAGHTEVVEVLLANGADVNAWGGEWPAAPTPLHMAVDEGHRDVAELLLAQGADVNLANSDGKSPLHLAIENGHTEVAKLLRQHGGKE
jgi:cytohesin